jgi:hypothetical protein
MKKLIIYSLILVGAMSLTSCEKWLNGQVINYDLPDHTPVLTIYNYSAAGDTAIDVRVGTSVGVLKNGEPQPVDDVVVKLFKNDVLQQSWSSDPFYVVDTIWSWFNPITGLEEHYIDSTYSYLEPLIEPISDEDGTKYSVEVSAPGYETTYAEENTPQKANVSVVLRKDVPVEARIDWGNEETGDIYEITINDLADEKNTYIINAIGTYTDSGITYENSIYFNSNDPIWNYSNGGMLLSDRSFDGLTKTVELEHWFYQGELRPDKISIIINTVADSYIDFDESMNKYWNADGNPFAEPVVLYSNVENGLGLFTLFNRKTIEIVR